jgi:hypothetical protein
LCGRLEFNAPLRNHTPVRFGRGRRRLRPCSPSHHKCYHILLLVPHVCAIERTAARHLHQQQSTQHPGPPLGCPQRAGARLISAVHILFQSSEHLPDINRCRQAPRPPTLPAAAGIAHPIQWRCTSGKISAHALRRPWPLRRSSSNPARAAGSCRRPGRAWRCGWPSAAPQWARCSMAFTPLWRSRCVRAGALYLTPWHCHIKFRV